MFVTKSICTTSSGTKKDLQHTETTSRPSLCSSLACLQVVDDGVIAKQIYFDAILEASGTGLGRVTIRGPRPKVRSKTSQQILSTSDECQP